MKNKIPIPMSDPILSKWWSDKNTLNINETTRGNQSKAIWDCPNGLNHTFERCINKFLNGRSKCPHCTNNLLLIGFNDLETVFPKIAREYSPNNLVKANEIIFTSTKKVLWSGYNCEHEWWATVNSRTRLNNNCPYCSRNTVKEGFNDLLTTHPESKLYWDFKKNTLKITEVSRGSNKIAWWINPNCGHSFEKPIKKHTLNGEQCPVCPTTFYHRGKDSFLERAGESIETKHLLGEWAHEKNSKNPNAMGAYSQYRAWWNCRFCSHSWRATVTNRFKGSGCPNCWRSHSFFEETVYKYLKESYAGVILRNRRPLSTVDGVKRELDFWLPYLNIAFEVNDFATHSRTSNDEIISLKYNNLVGSFKNGPHYHREKYLLAREQLDCELFFIWEDELLDGGYMKIIDGALG